jgi:hypothetical protein
MSSRECSGQVCDPTLGYCVDCIGDVDCPGGQRCEHSACVTPTIDAGIDAASPGGDGGDFDTGPLPFDASMSDTEVADVGPPDAGPPDTGLEPCATPGAMETVACPGMCATIDRFCNAAHTWQYGVCAEHGECAAGTTRSMPCGTSTVTQSCDSTCHWTGACAVDVVLVLDTTGSLADIGDTTVFRGVVPPTSDAMAVHTALGNLMAQGGGDAPEGGVIALSRLAGGGAAPMTGVTDFTCPVGTGAGGCWRPGARHAVVMISDAQFHNAPDGGGGIVSMMAMYPLWTPDVTGRLHASMVDVFSMTSPASVPMWNQMEVDLDATPAERVHSSTGFGSSSIGWSTEFGAVYTLIRTAYAL